MRATTRSARSMHRKTPLEDGELLQFFKTIYFFAECLAMAIRRVPGDSKTRTRFASR